MAQTRGVKRLTPCTYHDMSYVSESGWALVSGSVAISLKIYIALHFHYRHLI